MRNSGREEKSDVIGGDLCLCHSQGGVVGDVYQYCGCLTDENPTGNSVALYKGIHMRIVLITGEDQDTAVTSVSWLSVAVCEGIQIDTMTLSAAWGIKRGTNRLKGPRDLRLQQHRHGGR
jgi:hypothetical protein